MYILNLIAWRLLSAFFLAYYFAFLVHYTGVLHQQEWIEMLYKLLKILICDPRLVFSHLCFQFLSHQLNNRASNWKLVQFFNAMNAVHNAHCVLIYGRFFPRKKRNAGKDVKISSWLEQNLGLLWIRIAAKRNAAEDFAMRQT